jgi:hypothetical protein
MDMANASVFAAVITEKSRLNAGQKSSVPTPAYGRRTLRPGTVRKGFFTNSFTPLCQATNQEEAGGSEGNARQENGYRASLSGTLLAGFFPHLGSLPATSVW